MMSGLVRVAAVGIVAVSVAACNAHTGSRRPGGTLLGAALGGLAGSQIGSGRGQLAAVAVGTLMGALIGDSIGRSLDRADRLHARRAARYGLERSPSGRVSEWHNPDTGHSGTFEPLRTYRTTGGGYCREFQQTVTVDGRMERAYGTACRQPDGSWKIVRTT